MLLMRCRIVGFHTKIQAKQEVSEIEAYAKSITQGYLLIEFVYLKHTAWLVLIIFNCPYIAGVDKCT